MSRTSTLILLGVLTILAPFSGLPMTIRSLLAVIIGAWVLGIGISMRAHESHQHITPALPIATPPVETPSVDSSPI